MWLSELIRNSSRDITFIYLICVISIVYLISSSFTITFTAFVSICVAIYFVYDFGNSYITNDDKIFEDMDFKIKYLNNILDDNVKKQKTNDGLRTFTYINGTEASVYTTSFLYTDPEAARLMYSIRDYEIYSPRNYFKVLYNINILLKLKNDFSLRTPDNKIALQDCASNLKTAGKVYKNILNHFHSFIYSLPSGTYYKSKYKQSMKKLHILMKRNMDYMKNICDEKYRETGITNTTRFIGSEYDGVKFYDKDEQNNFYMYL